MPVLYLIIPGSIDDLIKIWEESDKGKVRLTLLNRTGNTEYCILTPNLQEVKPDEKIDYAVALKISPLEIKADVLYDAVLERITSTCPFIMTVQQEGVFEQELKLFPFYFKKKEFPSVVLDKPIEDKLFQYMNECDKIPFEFYERLGEKGLINAILYLLKANKREGYEKGKLIATNLQSKTKDLDSPSELEERALKQDRTMFYESNKKDLIISLLKLTPYLAATPLSYLIKAILGNLPKTYERIKPDELEREEQKYLGEYLMSHPKLTKGLEQLLLLMKHFANATTYAGLASITGIAYTLGPEIISYPLITATATSGAFMIAKLIATKGRDSAGIICTLLEYLINRNASDSPTQP